MAIKIEWSGRHNNNNNNIIYSYDSIKFLDL